MTGIVGLIQRVVQAELARQRTSLLGVVTAVFPHTAADDDNNYEVDLRLKHEDLELRRVPVAVDHVGAAAPARVGDLVLVQFLGGEVNQPLVTGRFYHDADRPPLHREDEVLFEQRVGKDGTVNHLRFTPDGSILLQRDVTAPEDGSAAAATIRIDGGSGDIEVLAGTKVVIKVTGGDPAVTITGNVTVKGDLTVSDGVQTTKISGHTIRGS